MHRALRSCACRNSYLDESSCTGIQRSRSMALVTQLLESLPDLRILLLKMFGPFGKFGLHSNAPFAQSSIREQSTSFSARFGENLKLRCCEHDDAFSPAQRA